MLPKILSGCYLITESLEEKITAPKLRSPMSAVLVIIFLATLTLSYLLTNDLIMSAKIATNCSSYSVARPETSLVNLEEFRKELRGNNKTIELFHPNNEQLRELFVGLKEQEKSIVFTNGCFDIIHPGHLKLLNFCKSKGDIVVCALDSDKSVTNLKGKGRPVNTFAQRAKLLSELPAVDYVIEFESNDLEDLLLSLKPDILVKGGDYTIGTVVGSEIILNNGGEVVIFPLFETFSSTKIIEKNYWK